MHSSTYDLPVSPHGRFRGEDGRRSAEVVVGSVVASEVRGSVEGSAGPQQSLTLSLSLPPSICGVFADRLAKSQSL